MDLLRVRLLLIVQLKLFKEFLSLPLNAGHSTDHKGKYSGWMRSILLGLEYAYLSDTEYFVYVEQDALLYGDNIVEKCIDKMTKPYMFGSGLGTKQPLQQSFFIIRSNIWYCFWLIF